MAAQPVLTARAGQWQSGVTLAGGDYRCLRCAEPVAPSARMLPEADSRFVCFACVDELRRTGDRGWHWLPARLGLVA